MLFFDYSLINCVSACTRGLLPPLTRGPLRQILHFPLLGIPKVPYAGLGTVDASKHLSMKYLSLAWNAPSYILIAANIILSSTYAP